MKKILAIALALVMVMGIAVSASALTWAAASTSSSASPFAIEVIKLGASSTVTGGKYYTVVNDAAVYNASNIYYAIKLTVPSYADANAYYGNSGFISGNAVKVTISYTNINGKSKDVVTVQLTNKAQTLWWNGKGFDATWAASALNNCGCGDNHIRTDVVSDTANASIKACVGAQGKLSDIKIDGCYKVSKKNYYGVKVCVNCAPVNLSGFLFEGECAANKLFFATNSAGKVTGIYVVPECCNYTQDTVGAFVANGCKLYGWMPSGTESDCRTNSCGLITYEKVELPGTKAVVTPNAAGWTWANRTDATKFWGDWHDDYMKVDEFEAFKARHPNDYTAADTLNTVYAYDDDTYKYYVAKGDKMTCWTDDKWGTETWYSTTSYTAPAANTKCAIAQGAAGYSIQNYDATGNLPTGYTKVKGTSDMYAYTANTAFVYKDLYRYTGAKEVDYLFKMTSATSVNCDTNEASYLNAINHMLGLLGFTYADVAAGNVYMTEDNLLANFGFATSVCSEKVWGAYTAAITVAAVAEVPATGSMSYVGFAMIVLAIAAAVVTKKVRA